MMIYMYVLVARHSLNDKLLFFASVGLPLILGGMDIPTMQTILTEAYCIWVTVSEVLPRISES
tara:strand:- start:206 stop:394 length:189 start_codon:yes stop_codon:yes gene_type:complete